MFHRRFGDLGIRFYALVLLSMTLIIACGGAASTPVVVEKEVVKEVIKEVVVEKEVIQEVTKEVVVEKEVIKEVVKEVVVVATPIVTSGRAIASDVEFKPAGILRIANKDLGPPQFLPKNMAVPQATYVSPVTFDALWKMSPDGELQNHLLAEWSVSEDQTKWKFTLKENIPFHKGWGNVTVQDFMWVVDQIQLEESRHPGKTNLRPASA